MVVKIRQHRDGSRELQLDQEPWIDEFAGLFEMKGCDSILVGSPFGPPVPEVGFLADLPGLKKVRFLRGVQDCSAVSRVPGLTSLALATDYRGPLSLSELTELTDLEMPYLPAVHDIAALTKLRSLYIWFWRKESRSFEILGDKPDLDHLRVEFKRWPKTSTAGLEAAPNLAELSFYDGRFTDLSGFAHLHRLRRLFLYGTKIEQLSFAEHMPRLRDLHLENCGKIESLAPIRGHSDLNHVVLGGRTMVADGDLSPLLHLPAATSITVGKRYPHYSHSLKEVRRHAVS